LENVINKLIKTKSFAEDDENVYILLKRDLIKPIRQIKLYLKTKILNDLDQLERRID
jgi:hypothetical protein